MFFRTTIFAATISIGLAGASMPALADGPTLMSDTEMDTVVAGAITTDWVNLTAEVVVIGIGIVYSIFGTGEDGVKAFGEAVASTTGEISTVAGADPVN